MNRDEFIKKVQAFAAHMAKYYGCDRFERGEDRQKGLWGERATAYLEQKYGGDCSTEITWDGGKVRVIDAGNKWECERPERRVKFRFRFAWPCVSVSLNHRSYFAEIQFNDEFELHETHAWGPRGGFDLLDSLIREWEEFDG